MSAKNTTVLLVNLGTPDEPSEDAIRRYLNEFLSDPRVVDLPRFLWLPILRLIILRVRPPKLVHNYKMIWGRFDGPIRNITRALAKRVGDRFADENITVDIAMTYGNPSVADKLSEARARGAQHIVIVPLFPQYAGATTGAVTDVVEKARQEGDNISFIDHYPDDPAYIQALASSIEPYRDYLSDGARLVFSFHGIPMSQVNRGDPYPEECELTARKTAEALGLADGDWQLTFQSRFGPAAWLEPYTADMMAQLPGEGVDKVLICCPGFATDCLETTEEIKVENHDIFMEAGGKSFRYVRALNARASHADTITALVRSHLESGGV